MTERCDGCRFWLQEQDIDGGYCRRYPPTVILLRTLPPLKGSTDMRFATGNRFPNMMPDGWCGEWQPKKEKVN